MAQNKTKPTKRKVSDFVGEIKDPRKRADCREIARMCRKATGKNAKMWGSSIVGYGTYDYKYASGREGSFFLCGYSPRAQNTTVYVMPGFTPFKPLMKKLGKYKTGKSCLYLKSLDDVDRDVLQVLLTESVKHMRANYKTY